MVSTDTVWEDLVTERIIVIVQRVKWCSATVILFAMVFHVLGLTPWNSILQMIGASGWVYAGLKTGEKAIVLNFLPQFLIIIPGLFFLYFTR